MKNILALSIGLLVFISCSESNSSSADDLTYDLSVLSFIMNLFHVSPALISVKKMYQA